MTVTPVAPIAGVVLAFLGGCDVERGPERMAFERVVVDARGPRDPWGKAVGDLNGDRRPDLIVGGHAAGGLVWYQNPDWRKHAIASTGSFSTAHVAADIDRDGRADVVSLMHDRLVWFRNGDWAMRSIDDVKLHDVEVADVDGDGRPDIVARGQVAFGKGGDRIHVYLQRAGGAWDRRLLECPAGEGLKVADLDDDGWPDIVVNGLWYRNPGQTGAAWQAVRFATAWTWPHTYIEVRDVNGDGRPDVILAPAERAGERYRISWFEAPADTTQPWAEHVVDPDVEAVHHFVGAADMDLDGRVDIVTAAMHQGKAPQEIRVYFNPGRGDVWIRQVVASGGSHSMRLVDIDGDGDVDLFGANWSGEHQPIELWVNQVCSPATADQRWRRHVVDARKPWRSVFIAAGDLDGDGRVDLATGGWWYRNPGRAEGHWDRRAFGRPAHNLALLTDVDGDGDIDALATQGRGSDADPRFAWAANDGRGRFRVYTNIASGDGDFLQGIAAGRFTRTDTVQVALSWHASGQGIQLLTVPSHPARATWRRERIAEVSQDEGLSAGDIDRDGAVDLLLGTRWLRNEGGAWRLHAIDPSRNDPDRNRLVDMNADGRLDAVVGFEAISRRGAVVWYEQGPRATDPWIRHDIGTVIGPMSLDVADMDGDGDLDVVVGEHNLQDPASARLLIFENIDGRGGAWRESVIHTGDEHHDGALVVDIDGDGDLDVVSIGWSHERVVWYENKLRCFRAAAAGGR